MVGGGTGPCRWPEATRDRARGGADRPRARVAPLSRGAQAEIADRRSGFVASRGG